MARLLFLSVLVSLQLVAQEAGSYSIAGTVVNSETGEPIRYALVTLLNFSAPAANTPQGQIPPIRVPKTTQTGDMGEFVFRGLEKGHYRFHAQKPGFVDQDIRGGARAEPIDLTDNVSGAQVRLTPLSVIEGKVVDQDGEPLRGVQIEALNLIVNDGLRYTNVGRSVATDDRGLFRLWNLQPGRYYLKAAGKSGGTYRYVGEANPYYSSWQGFAPVYSGGARTIDGATPVTIESGKNATVDFHLTLEPAFRIRGTVRNPPSGTVTFELVQGSEHVKASRSSFNTSTGRFEIQDVTPGSYLLRIEEQNKLRGEVPVTVADSDLENVTVSLLPPVRIEGTMQKTGDPMTVKQMPEFSRAQSAVANGGITAGQLEEYGRQPFEAHCSVSLRQPDTLSRISMSGNRVRSDQANDMFPVGDFFPGVYEVTALCSGGYVTGILAGGMDLLAAPAFSIQPGSAPMTIEVHVKTGGGSLTGDLPADATDAPVGILMVPAFRSTGPQMFPTGYGATAVPRENGFVISCLAPGDYTVYAFADWVNVEFRNPAFLQTLTGGVSVHIEDGKAQQISIKQVIR